MRRITIAVALVAAAAAVPAQAAGHGHGHGHKAKGDHGKSHRCKVHRAGWVVRGTVDAQSLAANADGTYSGDVTVDIVRTNKHARGETGTKTYTLTNVRAAFEGSDTSGDGSVDLSDVAAGDRVALIGKVTRVHKRCDQSGAGDVTIRRVVFDDPEPADPADQDSTDAP